MIKYNNSAIYKKQYTYIVEAVFDYLLATITNLTNLVIYFN